MAVDMLADAEPLLPKLITDCCWPFALGLVGRLALLFTVVGAAVVLT